MFCFIKIHIKYLACFILFLPLSCLASDPAIQINTKPQRSHIALTFDDGPDPRYTPKILDILKQYNIKATFFIIGKNALAYPNLVKDIQEQGHIIANHTMTHAMLTKLSQPAIQNEIGKTNQILTKITGLSPHCLRPPYGKHNKIIDTIARSNGLSVVTWDLNSFDYEMKGTEILKKWVLQNTHPGFDVLLHDGGGNRSQTIQALPEIIETLSKRGLQFNTICG